MELAMQFFSNDHRVRSETMKDLKGFNFRSLSTQVKKREQLVAMTPANKRAIDLLGEDIVDLSTEKDALINKIGSYDEKWLEKSKAKLLKEIDDEKSKNILIMSRMKKTDGKTLNKGLYIL